jgi:hypothetical protein
MRRAHSGRAACLVEAEAMLTPGFHYGRRSRRYVIERKWDAGDLAERLPQLKGKINVGVRKCPSKLSEVIRERECRGKKGEMLIAEDNR